MKGTSFEALHHRRGLFTPVSGQASVRSLPLAQIKLTCAIKEERRHWTTDRPPCAADNRCPLSASAASSRVRPVPGWGPPLGGRYDHLRRILRDVTMGILGDGRSEHRQECPAGLELLFRHTGQPRMAILLSLGAIPRNDHRDRSSCKCASGRSAIESGAVHRLLSCFADCRSAVFDLGANRGQTRASDGRSRRDHAGCRRNVSTPRPAVPQCPAAWATRCSSARFRPVLSGQFDRSGARTSGGWKKRVC